MSRRRTGSAGGWTQIGIGLGLLAALACGKKADTTAAAATSGSEGLRGRVGEEGPLLVRPHGAGLEVRQAWQVALHGHAAGSQVRGRSRTPAVGVAESAAVTLSPEGVRATGVAIVSATREALSTVIRAVGTIEIDETSQVRVAARVAGRIEKLYADFTGQRVGAGAPLYDLYSPDLVATEREYLLALENRRGLSRGTAEAIRAADSLVAATRDRLRLWGIGAGQIAALETQREAGPRADVPLADHRDRDGEDGGRGPVRDRRGRSSTCWRTFRPCG